MVKIFLLVTFPLLAWSGSGALAFTTNRYSSLTKNKCQPLVREPALHSPTMQRRLRNPSFFHTKSPLQVSLSPDTETEDETTLVELPQQELWEHDSKVVELVMLGAWMTTISAFILVNQFIGPWPYAMSDVPERIWFVCHMLGGMLFGGGVILTTAIEWMVAKNKNSQVLQFWFDKVPLLDAVIVLPALTVAMISGTGLSIEHYGGLGKAPPHISTVFYTLVAFAAWWAITDLTTQGSALAAVNEWAATAEHAEEKKEVPDVVTKRTISNVVSCLFVFALYGIMVLKPGTLHHW